MYKFIGLAMMGVFAMMIIPGNFDTTQSENTFYGMATMVKNDSLGNEAFQQTVHNALTDEGEDFLLELIFDDGAATIATNLTFGAICVSLASYDNSTSIEDATAVSFDTADQLSTANCKQSASDGGVGTTGSKATIGALQFTAGAGNVNTGDTIRAIGICQATTGNADFINCVAGGTGSGGKLLAVVDITATTLASGETVDITYTFDITSNTS